MGAMQTMGVLTFTDPRHLSMSKRPGRILEPTIVAVAVVKL